MRIDNVSGVPAIAQPESVTKALANHARVVKAHSEAYVARETAIANLQLGAEKDAAARTAAIVAGKDAVPAKKTEQAKRELAEAEARFQDHERAIARTAGDVRLAVQAAVRKGDWPKALEAEVEQARQALSKCLGDLRHAVARLETVSADRAALAYVERGDGLPPAGVRHALQVILRNGAMEEKKSASEVLSALDQIAAPPQPPGEAQWHGPGFGSPGASNVQTVRRPTAAVATGAQS